MTSQERKWGRARLLHLERVAAQAETPVYYRLLLELPAHLGRAPRRKEGFVELEQMEGDLCLGNPVWVEYLDDGRTQFQVLRVTGRPWSPSS